MTPVAYTLQRNLQRGVRRTRTAVFVAENIGHAVVEHVVDVLFVELLGKCGFVGSDVALLRESIITESYFGIFDGHFYTDGLMLFTGSYDVAVFAHSEILANDDLLRLGKVLSHLVDRLVTLTLIPIIYIRCTYGS